MPSQFNLPAGSRQQAASSTLCRRQQQRSGECIAHRARHLSSLRPACHMCPARLGLAGWLSWSGGPPPHPPRSHSLHAAPNADAALSLGAPVPRPRRACDVRSSQDCSTADAAAMQACLPLLPATARSVRMLVVVGVYSCRLPPLRGTTGPACWTTASQPASRAH
jgi:hypothetical protein